MKIQWDSFDGSGVILWYVDFWVFGGSLWVGVDIDSYMVIYECISASCVGNVFM